MQPVIGITASYDRERASYFSPADYSNAVVAAGGAALVLPDANGAALAAECLEQLDGLILSGGVDVDPFYFGEEPACGLGRITPERDAFEIELTRAAWERDLPILAICRGIQVLNVALGGTLYQDIAGKAAIKHYQDAPDYYPTHYVILESGSLLYKVASADRLRVNSFHHQAIREAAPGLRVTAVSTDGIIEGVEGPGKKWVVGVQWHPEMMARTDEAAAAIFREFISHCL